MDIIECAQCGAEVEGKGIRFRGRDFCGDECVEEFEARLDDDIEPDPEALVDEDDFDPDDDLGYRDDDGDEDFDDDDDDFAIDPDDF